MLPNHTSEPLPEGFKSWQEFNKAKKERKQLKQEYKLKKLDEQKQKELSKADEPIKKQDKKVCDEPSTLSIAVPGSILDNAQSVELRTYLAGQIARAACVYKVDEIIVYDDIGIQDNMTTKTVSSLSDSGDVRPARKCCAQLARILQYLECPQYLRKEFFPKHRDLDYAGLLNPLDAPHHMRQQDDGQFREGVVINQPAKSGCFVNVGLLKNVKVDIPLQPGIRVTVEMLPSPPEAKRLSGRVVPPSRPKKATGVYWGYSVRLASSLNTVFTECPYKEGYDVTIGTSERGAPVETVSLTSHQHILIVFGGLAGIEAALEADDVLNVDDPALLFDHYLNTCPDQGSRTIRTEEAVLITLAELRTKLKPKVMPYIQPDKAECVVDNDSNISLSSDEDRGHNSNEENIDEVTDVNSSMNVSAESCNKISDIKKKMKKRKKREVNPDLQEQDEMDLQTKRTTVENPCKLLGAEENDSVASDVDSPKHLRPKKKKRKSVS